MPQADPSDAAEDYGYQAFFDAVDAIVMGRHTYDLVRSFDEWPYGRKRVVVLSHHALVIPAHLSPTVTHLAGPPCAVCQQLATAGCNHLYVDGGKTIQGFLQAGLVDTLILSRVPVLIGAGLPLFGPLSHDIVLQHQQTQTFASGIVQSRYQIIWPSTP